MRRQPESDAGLVMEGEAANVAAGTAAASPRRPYAPVRSAAGDSDQGRRWDWQDRPVAGHAPNLADDGGHDIAAQAWAAWEAAVCWDDEYSVKRLAEVRPV